MKLNEVFNNHPLCQVVLSLTNNNEVLITKDDFNPNSKFYRMSKVRLSVDFELSGIIKDGVFIRIIGQELADNSNEIAYVYRTYRGDKKNDYVLYVYQGEYKLLEHYKKAVSHKKLIEFTKERKYNTAPAPSKILHICPHINRNDKTYWVSYKHDEFPCEYLSKQYPYTYTKDAFAYFTAVIVGLTIAKKYTGHITEIRISHPNDYYSKGVSMFPMKKWIARSSISIEYMNKINEFRREFQKHGISICFME